MLAVILQALGDIVPATMIRDLVQTQHLSQNNSKYSKSKFHIFDFVLFRPVWHASEDTKTRDSRETPNNRPNRPTGP